jgi:serine/threonine-protein kinase
MQPGTVIAGKYRLARRLGQGAMGVVWAAINELTERQVALKLIPKWGAESDEVRRRLLREARACGRLNHRNVVEIYDVGQTDEGEPFLVMQLLTGETLAELMKRERKLTPSFATFVALEVARALSAAHAAGIIHRDLKPPNIYLHKEPDGEGLTVKVLDFGVSKILATQDGSKTETGSAIGSPAYMSPEQARGERHVDHRTDLWAVGVVLFEMLTGKRPFQGETMFTVVADILGGRIPIVSDYAPEISPALERIVTRCIERDVSKRVATADELVSLLRPHAETRVTAQDANPYSRAFATGSYPNATAAIAAARMTEPASQSAKRLPAPLPAAGAGYPQSAQSSPQPQSAQSSPQPQSAQSSPQPQSAQSGAYPAPHPQSAQSGAYPAPHPQSAQSGAYPAPTTQPAQGAYAKGAQGGTYPQQSAQGAYPQAPQGGAYPQQSAQASYPGAPQGQHAPAEQKPTQRGLLRTTVRMDHAAHQEEISKARASLPSMSDAPTSPGPHNDPALESARRRLAAAQSQVGAQSQPAVQSQPTLQSGAALQGQAAAQSQVALQSQLAVQGQAALQSQPAVHGQAALQSPPASQSQPAVQSQPAAQSQSAVQSQPVSSKIQPVLQTQPSALQSSTPVSQSQPVARQLAQAAATNAVVTDAPAMPQLKIELPPDDSSEDPTSIQIHSPVLPRFEAPPPPPVSFGPPPPSEASAPNLFDLPAAPSLASMAHLSADISVLPSPLSTTSPITSSSPAAGPLEVLEVEPEPDSGHIQARRRKLVVALSAIAGAVVMAMIIASVKTGSADDVAQKPMTLEGVAPRHNAIAAAARTAAARALAARALEPATPASSASPSTTGAPTGAPSNVTGPVEDPDAQDQTPKRITPSQQPPFRRKKGGAGLPDDPG